MISTFNRLLPILTWLLICPVSYAQQQAAGERAQLLSADLDSADTLGSSVAVYGDTAVVGAPGDSDALSLAGAAYVFVESGALWSQEAKLLPDDAELFNTFGEALSISGDSILVGASGNSEGGSFAGAAYVFTRSAGLWTQEAKLLASDSAANDLFGFSVAIDGDTAVVGAFLDDDGGTSSGSAYVFVRSGGLWSQQSKLIPGDTADRDNFGERVAISGDTVLVGARHDDDAGLSSGSAYVFFRNGTIWTQQAKLVANDAEAFDTFGSAVAVSGDTALVSARLEDQGGLNAGAAYVFVRAGTNWNQQAKLLPADSAPGDLLGVSVSLDGNRAILGASFADAGFEDAGAAYAFVRNGVVWSEEFKLSASDAADFDEFGRAVALHGNRIILGAPGHDEAPPATSDAGSAYAFQIAAAAFHVSRQAGSNPASYTSTEPILGADIQLTVDLSLSGHSSAAVFAFSAPASIPISAGRVILVGGAELFMLPLASGPSASFNATVPSDLSLIGLTIYTQALHIFGVQPYALSNAIDLTAGF